MKDSSEQKELKNLKEVIEKIKTFTASISMYPTNDFTRGYVSALQDIRHLLLDNNVFLD